MQNTMTVRGSHGAVRVHKPTGIIIDVIERCYCCDCRGTGSYADRVALFDTNDIEAENADDMDILYIGFWDKSGAYEPAITHRTVFSEKWGEIFDMAVAKTLLPAPAPAPA